ncbi:hypothetical protein BP422_02225 [Brevibacillus formosus]|uniref:Uncharacterized protein n=1 Tax=Brevibacillus formosus TaxID=54913 RepID=A0A220MBV6_9BACL|nr:hypothetical protein [Brevibacillus formosus]ASJ52462.1 hypothetical protein BP422_02225 [Brevibacillus formosus]
MNDEKYDQLIQEAQESHFSENYQRELDIWMELKASDPDNPAILHNVALALMNLNRYEEALDIFNFLVLMHPYLSRAHNNRAVLLMKMGVEWEELLPDFLNALAFSEDAGGFWRHFVNICTTLTFGFEDDSEEIFDRFEQTTYGVIKERFKDGLNEKTAKDVRGILDCYRTMRRYRQAFALKKWHTAEQFLNKAIEMYLKIGLPNFARGVENYSKTNFALCRDLFIFIEELSSSIEVDILELIDELRHLINRTKQIIEKNDGASSHFRLLNAIQDFQNGLLQNLIFIATPNIEFVSNKRFRDRIKFLTSNSFISLGTDFVSMLDFIDKQCIQFNESLNSSAMQSQQINDLRNVILTKVQLFCNGLILDFKEIDISYARSMLGWDSDLLGDAKKEIQDFKAIVERQLFDDIYVNNKPQENIARGMLQAFLSKKSYREVKVKGGQTDILVFTKKGKIIYETKIWRGPQYHEQGYKEIEEYIKGEDDGNLAGVFYIIFDPTVTGKASAYVNGDYSIKKIFNRDVHVVVINLFQPIPSKK